MTVGEISFYGGIAGMIFSAVLWIISMYLFRKKRKKLIKEIEQEYE